MTTPGRFIGIDVAKRQLDIADSTHPGGASRTAGEGHKSMASDLGTKRAARRRPLLCCVPTSAN